MVKQLIPPLSLLLILLFLSFYFYADTINQLPSFVHAWTQSDRYAIALAFLENDMNIFKPQTFNLMTKEGVTAVDFPWPEYLVALKMKVVGTTEPWIFRGLLLTLSFLGNWYIFRIARLLECSNFVAISISVYTFTLPVLVYYQAGFIPSIPAFATLLIGYYYYLKYKTNQHFPNFVRALIFIVLAALCRSPFNIFLFAVLVHQAFGWYQAKQIKKAEIIAIAAAYFTIFSWLFYKYYLSAKYGSMFLSNIVPAKSLTGLWDAFTAVITNWGYQYFTKAHYILFLLALCCLAFFRKSKDNEVRLALKIQVLLALGGGIVYFFLMANQFIHHDYYFIDSFYPGIILFVILSCSYWKTPQLWHRIVAAALITPLLIFGSIQSKDIQKDRYAPNYWERSETARINFDSAHSLLDSLQIPSTAKILVLDAYSTNLPLILMKRRGYTVINTAREDIEEALENPFDFIVVMDVFLPSDVIYKYPELVNHLIRIGGNGKISVFHYSSIPVAQSLDQLLGIPRNSQSFPLVPSVEGDNFWTVNNSVTLIEDTFPYSMRLTSKSEFGPTFKLNDSCRGRKLLFSASFLQSENDRTFFVVLSASNFGELVYYNSFPVDLDTTTDWQNYSCLFQLPPSSRDQTEISCYIYNPDSAEFLTRDMRVTLY